MTLWPNYACDISNVNRIFDERLFVATVALRIRSL